MANKGAQTSGADSGKPAKDYVPSGHGVTDEQIRADVHALITSQGEQPVQGLTISVKDGVVTLEGTVKDEAQVESLAERIEGVQSVKRVDNRLHAN